jgi:hypothetical protein
VAAKKKELEAQRRDLSRRHSELADTVRRLATSRRY